MTAQAQNPSTPEPRALASARKAAAVAFLAWAAGNVGVLWVLYSYLPRGTGVSWMFTGALLPLNLYTAGAVAYATVMSAGLLLCRAPSRRQRWILLASVVGVEAITLAFGFLHVTAGFGLCPLLATTWLAFCPNTAQLAAGAALPAGAGEVTPSAKRPG